MNTRDTDLLAEIRRDVIDSNVPIEDILRKCVIMGGDADSENLRQWASRELRGYGEGEQVPAYRHVRAALKVKAQVGPRVITQQVAVEAFPEHVREYLNDVGVMRESISEIRREASGEGDLVQFRSSNSPRLAAVLDAHIKEKEPSAAFQKIIDVYWEVGRSNLHGVADQVRTSLAEFAAVLTVQTKEGRDAPTTQQVDHAFRIAVHGDHSSVIIQAPSSSGGSSVSASVAASANHNAAEPEEEKASKLWSVLRKPGTIAVGLLTLIGTIAGLGQWLKWDWPF
ncbi:hypothetical protein AB0J71_48495 [Nonomuraea sp. NPDC049637]|uniref:AbiTii domain-containing protein n=1 Tax=Nonomuraea sp. NPDC049637 TaxID=3154356 RepID=UPI00343D398A